MPKSPMYWDILILQLRIISMSITIDNSQLPNPQLALLGAILKIVNARDEITIGKKKWVRFQTWDSILVNQGLSVQT